MRQTFSYAPYAVLLGLGACADRTQMQSEAGREFALHLCGVQDHCNCDEDVLIPDCEERVGRAFAANEREALDAGLPFDSVCMDDFLGRIDALGTCETSYPEFGPLCAVYGGRGEVGEPCHLIGAFPFMVNCRLDLTCIDGKCAEIPPRLPPGAICSEDQHIVPTGDLGSCEPGFQCDSSDTRTCVPVPTFPPIALGEECTSYFGCVDGNICRPQGDDVEPTEERPGVCAERTPPGEPCTLAYECDRVCENGFCQVAPPRLCDALQGWADLHEPP